MLSEMGFCMCGDGEDEDISISYFLPRLEGPNHQYVPNGHEQRR